MLKKTKNVKLIRHFPCLVISCFLVFFIFLTDSVNVKADNNDTRSYGLPYDPYVYRDYNTGCYGNVTLLTQIFLDIEYANEEFGFNINPESCIMQVSSVANNYLYIYVLCDPYCSTSFNQSGFDIRSNNLTVYPYGEGIRLVYDLTDIGSGSKGYSHYTSSDDFWVFGNTYQTYTYNGYTYTTRFPFYSTGNFYNTSNQLYISVDYSSIPEEPIYEALDQLSDISSTTSTAIDNTASDLANQGGFFDTLISNLKNFFNALKNWIYSGFNNLSKNIKNFFGPFLSNLLNKITLFFDSFEDLKDKFSHFFEIINSIYNMSLENGEFSLAKLISVLLVPDQSDLNNVFQGTPVYTLYTGIISAGNNFYSTITGVLSNTPVYVFSLPTFTFCGKTFTGLQVNFDWYVPYKSYGDVIISAFLIIGYIRFLMNFIPNFFYGSGFIDHDVNNIQGRTDHL